MNRINLIGRIANDLELKKNETGSCKIQFSLAVPRVGAKEGLQQTDFFTVTVWNKQAENLEKYQGKGCLIAVEGELRKDQFEDSEGNKKYFEYVLANRIEYLSSTKSEGATEAKEESTEADPFEEFSTELTDEDLPF